MSCAFLTIPILSHFQWLFSHGYFVKVTPKKGKAKSLKATITVKNPALSLKAADVVAVGATEQITATVKPANTKVTFTSSDETIAKVDEKGVVTGVKAGDVTITAKAGMTTKTVTMTVKNVIFKDLAQTTANTFTAVVTGNTKNLKATDFSFVNVATKANVAIKSVAVDQKDATKVSISTYADLKDGKEYAITLDGTTKNITVTDGKVASVSVTPTEIPYGVETLISVAAKDVNGVVVAQTDADGNVPTGYDLTITTKTGYVNGNKLYLTNKGDTAVAKVVKHSFKYDTTGKEIETIESGDVTITAVDFSAYTGFAARIKTTGSDKFDNAKDGNAMPVGTDASAFIKITDANGKEVSKDVYAKYTVESSDSSALMVSGSFTNGQSSEIKLVAIKTGTVYILVKDTNGNVVASLPILVQDKAHPATLALNKSTATISKTLPDDTAVITATAKDQYGNNYTIGSDVTVKCTATSAKDTKPADVTSGTYYDVSKGTVTFKNPTAGTFVYEIKYTATVDDKDYTTNSVFVNVEVKEVNGNATLDYGFGDDITFDTTIDKDHKYDANKVIDVPLYELQGGVKKDIVKDDVTYKVVKDGKELTVSAAAAEDGEVGFSKESGEGLKVTTVGFKEKAIKKLATGTYNITATYAKDGKTYVRTTKLTITDKQPTLSATVKKTSVELAASTQADAFVTTSGFITFSYNGTNATVESSDIAKVEGKLKKADGTIINLEKNSELFETKKTVTATITKITVKFKVPETDGLTCEIVVPVDKAFTISGK